MSSFANFPRFFFAEPHEAEFTGRERAAGNGAGGSERREHGGHLRPSVLRAAIRRSDEWRKKRRDAGSGAEQTELDRQRTATRAAAASDAALGAESADEGHLPVHGHLEAKVHRIFAAERELRDDSRLAEANLRGNQNFKESEL